VCVLQPLLGSSVDNVGVRDTIDVAQVDGPLKQGHGGLEAAALHVGDAGVEQVLRDALVLGAEGAL